MKFNDILKSLHYAVRVEQYSDDLTKAEISALEKLKSRNHEILVKFSKNESLYKGTKIVIAVFPIASVILVTALTKMEYHNVAIVVGILSGLFAGLLTVVDKFVLRNDIGELKSALSEYEMKHNENRLLTQLALLHESHQVISKDDHDKVKYLSEKISSIITNSIESRYDIHLKGIIEGTIDFDVTRVQIEIPDVPEEVTSFLIPVARTISEACLQFFGQANFEVKIYLRTEHQINGNSVSVMTSLARFPPKNAKDSSLTGRSFIKGEPIKHSGLVWRCYEAQEVLCVKEYVKPHNPNERYESLAFLSFGRMGVVAIESSEKTTFHSEKVITDDIRLTIQAYTGALVREALLQMKNNDKKRADSANGVLDEPE